MAVTLVDLPVPGSSQLEVMFRRLLLHCATRAQQTTDIDSYDWRLDPKFHCMVESLQEKLYDLELSVSDRPSPDILLLYKAHVKAITDQLKQPDLPAYCIKASARTKAAVASNTVDANFIGAIAQGAAAAEPSSRLDNTSNRPQQQASAPAKQRFEQSASGTAVAANADASFTLSRNAQERLQTQQRLQDELTTELLDMGQELKASTLAMQNAIRYRGKLLDDAEVAVEHSTANAQSIAAKAKQQYKQSSWNFCQTLLLLLVMAVIFSAMIVYIKLTSMVGLKGR